MLSEVLKTRGKRVNRRDVKVIELKRHPTIQGYTGLLISRRPICKPQVALPEPLPPVPESIFVPKGCRFLCKAEGNGEEVGEPASPSARF